MKILGVCGSLQRQSANHALLEVAAASTPVGVEVVLFDGLRELPHFNPDIDASGAPESVRRWRRALAESDAVLIASPEYGFSLPGVLKNGIDWVIGSGELEGKVIAITPQCPLLNVVVAVCRHSATRSPLSAPRSSVENRFPTVWSLSGAWPTLCVRSSRPLYPPIAMSTSYDEPSLDRTW
jgi:hypothetical protein